MELVLRKRVCINVYKRQSFTEKLFKKIGMQWDTLHACGVQYEIVSNIPKVSYSSLFLSNVQRGIMYNCSVVYYIINFK